MVQLFYLTAVICKSLVPLIIASYLSSVPTENFKLQMYVPLTTAYAAWRYKYRCWGCPSSKSYIHI